MTTPPRLAELLLARLLAPTWRDDVTANLRELHQRRVERDGAGRARAWYWRQACAVPARLWIDRLRQSRERPTGSSFRQLREDVRFAIRSFRRSPAYTMTTAGTLALGLAANTLVFTIVNAAILRPLPFPDAQALVWLWPSGDYSLTQERFLTLQRDTESLAALSAWGTRAFVVNGGSRPVSVFGLTVSPNHFEVLGQTPLLGRGFDESDGRQGASPVALISHAVWRDWFGGASDVLGREVRLDVSAAIPMVPGAFTGVPRTIIGVLPPQYRPFGFDVDVVTPLVADRSDPVFSNLGELNVVARLQDQLSVAQFNLAIDTQLTAAAARAGTPDAVAPVAAVPLHDALVGGVRPIMLLTLGAAGLVLLVACANVAHLTLARMSGRRHEFAVRRALGASRWRIARQLVTEGLVLCSMAGGLALGATWLLLPPTLRVLPASLAPPEASMDAAVFGFTALGLVLTLIVSLAPTMRTLVRDTGPMSTRSEGGSGAGGQAWMHQGLVAGELALALALTCSAGLLVQSFSRLTGVDPGFAPDGVMTVRIAPSDQSYADVARRRQTYADVLTRIRAMREVRSAGAIHFLPIADGGPSVYFRTVQSDESSRSSSDYRVVTPGYFETMGIPVVAGRTLTEADATGAPGVGLVNERLAAALWPGEPAVGKHLFRSNGNAWFEVIGVVGDVRQRAIGVPPTPEIYLPLAQSEWASAMSIVVRGPTTAAFGAELESLVLEVDANLPITRVASLTSLMGNSIAGPRFYGTVFSAFGGVAVVLGGLGVYGIAIFTASRRRRELGIRVALGASRQAIVGLELRRGLGAAGVGLLIGLGLAIAGSRLLSGLLFEVSPVDPVVFGSAVALLGTVALTGVLIPARRSSRVDPMLIVREE